MNLRQWNLPVLGISIIGGTILAIPTNAQELNHDVGGTNIFSAPNSTSFGTSTGVTPVTIDSASSLSTEINQTLEDVTAIEEAAQQEPKRIVRRRESKQCVNPATEELNNKVKQAQQLIEEQNEPQSDNRSW
jgi:hypothetical protein